MRHAQARTTYLKDYQPPAYLIDKTDLHFDLFEEFALVTSTLSLRRNEALKGNKNAALVLHGQNLLLEKLLLNGKLLTHEDYLLDEETLTIPELGKLLGGDVATFTISCHTRIEPHKNTALEGLYKSRRMFCTQCEAEGFRRITYYLDRPDVMSVFTTTIVAEKDKYPVLLSNGNKIADGIDENNPRRHWVTWQDPFKKPSYLFALVAGDLKCVEDQFVTCSNRTINLQIFVDEKDLDKCDHAMLSLKNAMRWDEQVYGREYDLDIFMIVAVDDFNMGAMENKGLNIFNTSCVLANPLTTVDAAFQRVEAVVAHEYFHNWSGNRVTCRDWFQLSLKEGFTVFRDATFSADMGSPTVQRIEEVAMLRTAQFAEDAGPMAHPVRPDSYMEISNFYTVTIYEKGAEVVRMISNILGAEKFRTGTDLYFERHDGQAVTTEEFVKAMEDASGIDLSQFRRWYTQAGTPVLHIDGEYDQAAKTYQLRVRQSCPATPGQDSKQPFHIPLKMGLLNSKGEAISLRLDSQPASQENPTEQVLDITQADQLFVFKDIASRPVPSLLRGFSAPVRLNFDYSADDLYFLMVHDSDGFNRWNAAQQLAVQVIHNLINQRHKKQTLQMPEILLKAYSGVLQHALADAQIDKAMVSQLLILPQESYLIEIAEQADVEAIHEVREFLAGSLADSLGDLWLQSYAVNSVIEPFQVTAQAVGRRALKNLSMAYLMRNESTASLQLCVKQFEQANNMTDQSAALNCLVNSAQATANGMTAKALASFYQQWQHEPLVMDLWLSTQARCQLPETLEQVKHLMQHPVFTLNNPNKVRALLGAFTMGSLVNFHHSSGAGYRFLAAQIITLDKLNPQIASRMLTPLTRWMKYDPARQELMKGQLALIRGQEKLSSDVFEVLEKSMDFSAK